MNTVGKKIAILLMALMLALTSFAMANEPASYALNGENVIFYGNDGPIEAAQAGETITLDAADLEFSDDEYFVFISNDVTISDDYSFVMPDHDVTVTVVTAEKGNLPIDLTGDDPQPIPGSVRSGMLESTYLYERIVAGEGNAYDLNLDGFADVQCINNGTRSSLQRMEGASKLTTDYEDIPLAGGPFLPYKTITFKFIKTKYRVTVNVNDAAMGQASATPASGGAGAEVTLTATSNDGYRFVEWQVVSGGVTIADNKLTIASADVEVMAIFEAIPTHTLTVKYVYGDNSKAADNHSETLAEGAAYEVESPAIEDFKPDKAKVSGTMGTEDVTETVTYTASHSYGEPTWKWADDYKSAKATFTCTAGDDTQTVDATVTCQVKTQPDCVLSGTGDYTAKATFGGKEYTDEKKDVEIPATGHVYGDPEWVWEKDFESAKAKFTCVENDNVKTLDATVTTDVGKQASCTEAGSIKHTASVTFLGSVYADQQDEAVPATGHSYGKPTWSWAKDYSAATATFKCKNGDDTKTLDATITSAAVSSGGTKYTAAVEFLGVTYTDDAFDATVPMHTLTISYVGEDGAKVAEPFTGQFAEGAAYAVASPVIPRLIPDRAEVTGTMGAADVAETVTYSDDEVTIIFNSNNSKLSTVVQTAIRGEKITLRKNTFTLKNYRFMGWNTEPDGIGKAYADGAEITPTEDMTLFAQWSRIRKLSFNSFGGSGNMHYLEVATGETVTLPKCAFTRDKYTFAGWNTMKNGSGTPYADGAKFKMPAKDTTLYAQWEGMKATVGLNKNVSEAQGSMKKITTTLGAKLKLPKCAFTYGDKAFMCWTTNKDGTGKAYADGATITVDQAIIHLYAQWKGIQATVKFTKAKKVDPITVTVPAKITLPGCEQERKGYAFTGWMDNAGLVHAPGDRITVRNSMTLKAQWTKTKSITYKINGGKGEMASQSAVPGAKVRLAPCAFTRDGYTFSEWNTKKDGSGTPYKDQAKIKMPEKDLKLFAQWKKDDVCEIELTTVKTISKSKDLKLEAVVKINGEILNKTKEKDVTFTVAGIVYKVKISGGVAKCKIKKAKLKDLDVGSTVKYSVSYGKTTVTKKAKVVE